MDCVVLSLTSSAAPQLGHSTPRAVSVFSLSSFSPLIASSLKRTERPTDHCGSEGSL